MAARRLLIVMLVLLGISSVIAIVVPEPDRDDSPAEETTTTGETGTTGETATTGATGAGGTTGENGEEAEPGGEVQDPPGQLRKSVELDAGKPAEIKAKAGSRLILTVTAKEGSEVEIEGLGLTGFADQFAPAVFDVILPAEPGKFEVRAPGEKPGAVIKTNT